MFSVLARIQALLGKAAEKPYQAKLLEARINSCRALLDSLDSRIGSVHLEPMRIKLDHVEALVLSAGTQFHVYALTDESLARAFEQASAALLEEETTLALVARAFPPVPRGRVYRGRSTSGSRSRRRRTASRSTSSHRSQGRSVSPNGEHAEATSNLEQPHLSPWPEASGELSHDVISMKSVRVRSFSLPEETGSAMLDHCRAGALDPCVDCLTGHAVQTLPSLAEAVSSTPPASPKTAPSSMARFIEAVSGTPSSPVAVSSTVTSPMERRMAPELVLPLPDIHTVEREPRAFWQDSITLVFRCAASGQEHRVTTQQWSGSAGERLVSWAGTPSWIGKTWEEEMEQDSLSLAAQEELKQLLVKSGWYDKFRFDTDCGTGAWVINEVANAGYEPCSED